MRILSRTTLQAFWSVEPRAKAPLEAWFTVVEAAAWQNFAQVRQTFNTADAVGDSRVIFDVGGNKYRIVARISYAYGNVKIKFVGTHAQYDKIDPETV